MNFRRFKKITASLVLIAGFSFFSGGCLEEIDFTKATNVDDLGLAIQGKLVKGDPSYISVTIRKIFNFEDTPRLISGREVTLISEDGKEFTLESRTDGVYNVEIPEDEFPLEFGKSYKLRVETFDNRRFESGFDELHPVPQPDDLKVERTQIEVIDKLGTRRLFDQLNYSLSSSLKPEGSDQNARLLFEMDYTYRLTDSPNAFGQRACRPVAIDQAEKVCYINSAPVENYKVLNGRTFAGDRIDDYELLTTSFSSLHAEGVYLSVLQQSLSQNAFDYWSQVNEVVNRTGGIFQAPAGKIQTNFTNIDDATQPVFGYFYVTEEKLQRVYVDPELADNQRRTCPPLPGAAGIQANPECCNCATQGTTEKPTWWLE